MGEKKSATVRATSTRPKHPKVDRGQAFEQLVRQMFKGAVDEWCRENLDEQPTKEVKGSIVDNLTAEMTSSLETTVDAATSLYLSTFAEDDGDDDEDSDDDEDDESDDEDDESVLEGEIVDE